MPRRGMVSPLEAAKMPMSEATVFPNAAPQLGHALKPRQLIMMGLGSAIGAMLLLRSNDEPVCAGLIVCATVAMNNV